MSALNKKSPRSFQCRDALWTTFEDMAGELECSVDYLINDAMKQYARQRGYSNESSQSGRSPGGPPPTATSGALPPPAPNASALGAPLPPAAPLGAAPPPPPPTATRPGGIGLPPPPVSTSRRPPPPLPGLGPASLPPPLPNAPNTSARPPQPPTMSGHPAPTPVAPGRLPPLPGVSTPGRVPPPPLPDSESPQQKLTILFQGQPHPVNKDRFIIGRGKSSSDLTIRDPNVSRQHALVEFSGGNFYMVDMGSTNGIEFSGQRVQRKAIQNGDVFRICDHELYCSMS